MAKRLRSDMDGAGRHKRQHVETPSASQDYPEVESEMHSPLSRCVDDLIEVLNEFKTRPHTEEIQRRLAKISKQVSPIFSELAGDGKGTGHRAARATSTSGQDQSHLISTPLGNASLDPMFSIPDLSFTTPWTTAEISPSLPPLPKILVPDIENAVFRHPGLGDGINYERLEWLGDAYIEIIATNLIFQTFGKTSTGRCVQMRELLVRNQTLAEYFRAYDMASRAHVPPDVNVATMPHDKARQKDTIKVQGDIFEAYVAGIIASDPKNGLANAVTWLKALWGRTIQDQIRKAEGQKESERCLDFQPISSSERPVEYTPKEQLAQKIVVKGIRLRYEDMPGGAKKDKRLGLPLFPIGLYLDGWGETGKLLAVASGMSKKEAGQKAAAVALQNRKLMKLYNDKKIAFLKASATEASVEASVET